MKQRLKIYSELSGFSKFRGFPQNIPRIPSVPDLCTDSTVRPEIKLAVGGPRPTCAYLLQHCRYQNRFGISVWSLNRQYKTVSVE